MTDAHPDLLGADPRPLFFAIGNADRIGPSTPPTHSGAAVRTRARTLAGMQKEAITVNDANHSAWRFVSDEGPYLAGHDVAPCPLSFFTTGMAADYMNEILAMARQHDVRIGSPRLILDNLYSMEGSVLRGTMAGGALAPRLTVQCDADSPDSVLQDLVETAARVAPVSGLLGGAHESLFSLSHNGVELAPSRVSALRGPPQQDPTEDFFEIARADEPMEHPIRKLAAARRIENERGGINTSLEESQDRVLHCRGICTVREDGVRQIDQALFKPIGSSFRFLSDETSECGGGRAPDAASYISAGIAFCFMTQFGRYAEIVKQPLDSCRIVQDTAFSPGDRRCGKGVGGTAEAVETHVYLESSGDDEFAREALDMSEQTCFLHALCRTSLATSVEIENLPSAVGSA
ncbi:MAG TPA: OsmC family protein [Acidobacteriota bacterium]|nr:OsmC family protein [Acidobacteriota bacterium]